MDVLRGYDGVLVIMLKVCHLVQELPVMMVVYERYRPGNFFSNHPFLCYKFLPYQIPKRLGPVGIALLPDKFIELLQQVPVKRNPKPH